MYYYETFVVVGTTTNKNKNNKKEEVYQEVYSGTDRCKAFAFTDGYVREWDETRTHWFGDVPLKG